MSYVLVVDDDRDFASAVAKVVKSTGHKVEIKADIKSAEESIKAKEPDLMILDVMFPENDAAGFEFARKIQGDDKNKRKFPILMLTAINSKVPLGFGARDIDDAWLPVDEFLEKPIDLNVLRNKVVSMLNKPKPTGK